MDCDCKKQLDVVIVEQYFKLVTCKNVHKKGNAQDKEKQESLALENY